MEDVKCFTDGRTWYSEKFPDRAAQECLAGYAIYLKGRDPEKIGVADHENAERWLRGDPIETIKYLRVIE